MTNSQTQMTRWQMHSEALAVETILITIQALFGASEPQEDLILITEIATKRAKLLCSELESPCKCEGQS